MTLRTWICLAVGLGLGVARVFGITWTGAGDGRTWGMAANWDEKRVPAATNDVVIPPRSGDVEHVAGTTTIRSLSAPGGLRLLGGTLRLTAGESRVGGTFVVSDGATLEGVGRTVSLLVDGTPVEWGGAVQAKDGAVLRLRPVVRLRGNDLSWLAEGAGSRIEAPGVTNITLGTADTFPVLARDGAWVDLSGLGTIRGPLRPTATTKAVIDLGGLRGRWTSAGFNNMARLTATTGGRIEMGGITELESAGVTLDAAEAIATAKWVALTDSQLEVTGAELDFGAMANIDGSDVRMREGAVLRLPRVTQIRGDSPFWLADGPDSLIDAQWVTSIALNTAATFPIQVRNLGRVNLSGLGTIRGPLRPDARGEGVVDLSGLRGRWTSLGFNNRADLTAIDGGRIEMPGITEIDQVNVDLDSAEAIPTSKWVSVTDCLVELAGGELDFGSVTNVDASDLRVNDGGVIRLPRVERIRGGSPYWLVTGAGSLIDASSVLEISLNAAATFPIQTGNQGRVDLSGLESIRGPLRPDARRESEIDLGGLRGRWTSLGFNNQAQITAIEGGRIVMPGITEIDTATVTLDSVKGLETAQWVALTEGSLQITEDVWNLDGVTNVNGMDIRVRERAVLRLPKLTQIRGNSPYWLVDGPGTLLDARSVREVSLNRAATFPIQARNEARIYLSGLTLLQGPLRPDARGGAVIDLSGARGFWSSEGFNNQQGLYASTDGWVWMPGITGFESGTLTVEDTGRIDTGQIEQLIDSEVTVTGFDAVLAFGNLRDQTGSTFRTSNGGQIIFTSAPRIVQGPAGSLVPIGASLVLSVDADGDGPLSYQWYQNGQPLRGAVGASLRLVDIGLEEAGSYSVSVRNAAGLISSEPVSVRLIAEPLPFDDAFARRGLSTRMEWVGTGNNREASVDPEEPRHVLKRAGNSIWLTWRAPQSGVVTMRTTGSSFDTLLAVYVGNSLGILASNEIASDDDGGGFLTSLVRFNARQGVDYEIAISGFAGASGDVMLSWTLDPASPELPEISQQPQDALGVVGGRAQFSVVAGPPGVTYQWARNGTPIPGETRSSLELPNVRSEDAGTYRVEVRTTGGATLVSSEALLEVVDRVENASGLSADKLDDLFTDAELAGAESALMGVRTLAATGSVGVGLPGGQWTDNTGSTRSPGDPVVCDVATSATRWFRLQLKVPAVPEFVLHTEGSEIGAFLAVFTNHMALTLLACDAALMPTKPAARVTFPARSGVDYLVLVDGVDGAQGRIKLNWVLEEVPPPIQRPQLSFDAGRLVIQMFPLPGLYDWQVGSGLGGWQNIFRTNLTEGTFRYMDPDPATGAARFFWLKPVVP